MMLRVVELVGEDDLAAARERGDDPDVGEVARAEQERGVGTLERRQPVLELAVELHRPRDQPRRARPAP